MNTRSPLSATEAMEAAVRRIVPLDRKQIAEPQIKSAVHSLLVTGGKKRRGEISSDSIQKELKNAGTAAKKLCAVLDDLHPSTAALLGNLRTQARIIQVVLAGIATAHRDGQEKDPQLNVGSEHLTPPQNLALAAAYVFVEMTGQMPTVTNAIDAGPSGKSVSGKYVDFLTEVFGIRDLSGGIETAAKMARDILKAHVQ